MTRIAIIGGGTSGLMTAYLLERKYENSIRMTLFEATDRIGGKIMTRRFDSAPVMYEAGVAKIYDYEGLGPNPLRRLIRELGLKTKPVEAQPVLLNGKLLRNEHEIKLHCGDATLRALDDFRRRAASMMPIDQYSIEGGMETLPRALRERLTATDIELNAPVARVRKNQDESYRVYYHRGREVMSQDFEMVIIALPHNRLSSIEWGSERLRLAIAVNVDYYHLPAHYLSVSILFKTPFWRRLVTGSGLMPDAFGGCCVYDEGARRDADEYGVLSWLLAGSDALSLVNLDDQPLIELAIESLPDELYKEATEYFIEGKVHRWVAAVNAQPDGPPLRDARSAHLPDLAEHPGIFIVGDYLFDSTLNGAFESANFATDLMRSRMPTLPLRLPEAA